MNHQPGTSQSPAASPLAHLSDDEVADLAEQAMAAEDARRLAAYDQAQALALQHLRGVIADLVNNQT